jgi:hypothetical protein
MKSVEVISEVRYKEVEKSKSKRHRHGDAEDDLVAHGHEGTLMPIWKFSREG